MISVARWGKRLHGKATAEELRYSCEAVLPYDSVMHLNMAGVKDMTVGFAHEAFGNLYLEANRRGSRIKFTSVSPHLRPILLAGVRNAIRL